MKTFISLIFLLNTFCIIFISSINIRLKVKSLSQSVVFKTITLESEGLALFICSSWRPRIYISAGKAHAMLTSHSQPSKDTNNMYFSANLLNFNSKALHHEISGYEYEKAYALSVKQYVLCGVGAF